MTARRYECHAHAEGVVGWTSDDEVCWCCGQPGQRPNVSVPPAMRGTG